MKLQMKFKDGAPEDLREQVIGQVSDRGASKVEPLFPSSADASLNSIYVIDLEDQKGKELLDFLESADQVEFAEVQASRQLA